MDMAKSWASLLADEISSDYYIKLWLFLESEYAEKDIYPPKSEVFTALCLTPPERVKVIILGQDPYHGEGQAHGLSFSVASASAKFPPSLRNIFKELKADIGVERQEKNLSDWAEQGVLLLNTVLTVEKGKAASHRNIGWEKFTDAIISHLGESEAPKIFVFWGADARKKASLIKKDHHIIIESPHPSPLSAHRGFFGSRPFSKINKALLELGETEIKW